MEVIRKEIQPGTIALQISGEVRTSNDRQRLTQSVEEEIQNGVRRVILDLSGLQIIDSAGVGSTANWKKSANTGPMPKASEPSSDSGG